MPLVFTQRTSDPATVVLLPTNTRQQGLMDIQDLVDGIVYKNTTTVRCCRANKNTVVSRNK